METIQTYELRTNYNNRQSFYGKAQVVIEGNKITLQSYSTKVAYIEKDQAFINGTYSQTTLRHIREFLLQHGFKADNKKQILSDYSI